jgi:hypothetical protein
MRGARAHRHPHDDADGQAAWGYPSGVDASLSRYRGSATPGYSWGTALRFGKMEKLQSTISRWPLVNGLGPGLRHRHFLTSLRDTRCRPLCTIPHFASQLRQLLRSPTGLVRKISQSLPFVSFRAFRGPSIAVSRFRNIPCTPPPREPLSSSPNQFSSTP